LIQIKGWKIWLLQVYDLRAFLFPFRAADDSCPPLGVSTVPTIAQATAIHMDDRFAQDVVRHKGTPDSAFVRFNAERLRSTTRRDVGNAIAALFSRCVIMRDTVSIVSPR
jgi:hypothetical protein